MVQEEACKWSRKHKQCEMVVPFAMGLSKCHKFTIITIDNKDDEEETPSPFIAIQLGNERLETYAFIVSEADGNTISYKLIKQLKYVHLKASTMCFNPIINIQLEH